MGIFLTLWGVLAGFFGVLVMTTAKTAVHEIEAGLGFLIATVAIGCAAIVEEIKKGKKSVPPPPSAS
jgi:putative Mn2+ efflux pump MntP